MKLEIYNDTPKPEEETPVLLKLVRQDRGVSLQAVDQDGVRLDNGHLLFISNEGVLELNTGINDKLGFQLVQDRSLLVSGNTR